MIWKFCEIWKIVWELASRWAKFYEILSHIVRYGMYANDLEQELLYSLAVVFVYITFQVQFFRFLHQSIVTTDLPPPGDTG